ncbi:MAG: 4Fe-4S binding protein [Tissierellaceae bacterium]
MERIYAKKEDCCGCSACYNACPLGAIVWKLMKKAFCIH